MAPLSFAWAVVMSVLLVAAPCSALLSRDKTWPQFARTGQHSGFIPVTGQALDRIVLSYKYDQAVDDEIAQYGGDLLVHYMTPLTEGDAVFMVVKKGPFNASLAFATQTWGVTKFEQGGPGAGGAFVQKWTTWVDYKAVGSASDFWEPVFHCALASGFLFSPGGQGRLLKLDKETGAVVEILAPPAPVGGPHSYVTSPITVGAQGELFYTVIQVNPPSAESSGFYDQDVAGSWLLRVSPTGAFLAASFADLVPDAPATCLGVFSPDEQPWPPNSTALPPSGPCGSVRAGINAAPAVSPGGGFVVVAARTQFYGHYSWLVAADVATLKPVWAATLRGHFHDGCGTPNLPPNGAPGGCRAGANYGVEPATNFPGAGLVLDVSSASPVIAPDGTIYYGAYTTYNYEQGHLMHFSAEGEFLNDFGFGWDTTPAFYEHDGTFSLITKENHYGGVGAYCDSNATDANSTGWYCPTDRGDGEAYFITQLSPDLKVEWRYTSNQTATCQRNATTGDVSCTPGTNPHGFEWCVNAPAIDARGTVYVNSEDGWLYAIDRRGQLVQRIFQQTTLGAAYTPASIGPSGLIFSQNSGYLFVVGA